MIKTGGSQESITSEATYSVFRCWNSVMSLPLKSFEFSQMRLFATSSWCYCCFVLNVDVHATLQFLEISSCHNPCCEMFKPPNRIDVLATGFAISWSLRWEQRRRGHFLWIGLKHMHIVHIYPPGDSGDILCHISGLHDLLYIFPVVSSYQLLHTLLGMIMICCTVCKYSCIMLYIMHMIRYMLMYIYRYIHTYFVLYMYITRLDDPRNRFGPKRRGSRSIHDGMWRALLRWGRGKLKEAAFLAIVGLGEMYYIQMMVYMILDV